jgi:hypothetical protein
MEGGTERARWREVIRTFLIWPPPRLTSMRRDGESEMEGRRDGESEMEGVRERKSRPWARGRAAGPALRFAARRGALVRVHLCGSKRFGCLAPAAERLAEGPALVEAGAASRATGRRPRLLRRELRRRAGLAERQAAPEGALLGADARAAAAHSRNLEVACAHGCLQVEQLRTRGARRVSD